MKYFLSLSIILIIYISGCTQQSAGFSFGNNVITIQNFDVDTLSPYSDKNVNINFDVKNNGDKPVSKITVNFFDTPGFTVVSLECNFIPSADNRKCEFTNLDSLDIQNVHMILRSTKITSPTTFTTSISVSYDYSGSREATIPVIDSSIRREPLFKFSQSQPTVGPVTFEINPKLDRQRVVNDQTITEYWGIKNQEFATEFTLKNVGNAQNAQPVSIPAGKLKFETINLQVSPCSNFDISGNSGTSKKAVSELVGTITCSFKPVSEQSEFNSIIKLSYEYKYEFIRSVEFDVNPEPQ